MRVGYTASGYPAHYGPSLVGTQLLDITWGELVWASVTVGRQGWRDVFANGRYSIHQAIFRESMIYANLRENSRGLLARSAAYADLDPSEKSAVSYFLGLTLSRLMCHRFFNIAWLMHLDRYTALLRPRLSGRSRPDLVGMNNRRDWIIAESKGRSNGLLLNDLTKAKAQTRKLRMVAGAYPALRCAIVTHFKGNTLHVTTADPEGWDKEASDLELNPDDFMRDYYSPIVDLFKQDLPEPKAGVLPQGFKGCSIESLDISIGVRHEAIDALGSNHPAEQFLKIAPEFLHGKSETKTRAADSSSYIGSDGVIVSLGRSWGKKMMHLQPEKRGL